MGVCGTGKTTYGNILSQILNYNFYEGDDFHTYYNKYKMYNNIPLNDSDRYIWLSKIKYIIERNIENGIDAIITCSCLKKQYRKYLGIPNKNIKLIYLSVPNDLEDRLDKRDKEDNHYMKKNMIQSQLDILEIPDLSENCIFIEQ